MSSICKKCAGTINKKSPGLFCAGDCRAFYHSKCVQLPTSALPALTTPGSYWKCADCRDVSDCSVIIAADSEVPSCDISSILKSIQSELSALNSKYNNIIQSVNTCTLKLADFEQSLNFLNEKYKEIDTLKAENISLRADLTEMSKAVHNLEQRGRLQNLEIQGVPQVENENLFAVLKDIGDVIKCSINEEDIEVVHRVAHGNKSSLQVFYK
ncbi:hypothetical protein QE152_g15329 [Popillia japonica]|uniref:PHD-type domain-containing protein n=1 Tax=Popillia japonica TaxID=7064 RepID=A0AAW1L8T7_POPJA